MLRDEAEDLRDAIESGTIAEWAGFATGERSRLRFSHLGIVDGAMK